MPSRLALAAAALAGLVGAQAAPGPLPPLPSLPSAASASSPLAPLLSAVEAPGRLADAYAEARHEVAAQQWAAATKGKKAETAAKPVLPPSAAAARPRVVESARAAAGAPNPTAATKARTGEPPADPVEAVVEAGADAVSGRPPRPLEVAVTGGPLGGGGGRRLSAAAKVADADAADSDAAPAPKPRLSKYKLFKTADPHRGAAAGLASIMPPHVALPALPGRR